MTVLDPTTSPARCLVLSYKAVDNRVLLIAPFLSPRVSPMNIAPTRGLCVHTHWA